MSEYNLMCNVVKCRKELKNQAWVTCCSHIFCIDHGQKSADKEKCLTCNNNFNNEYDIVIMDLNPSESHKSMVLAGLSPEKILDIAGKAINFWTYQMYHEKLVREEMFKLIKQQCSELTHYCNTEKNNHKMEIQKLCSENDEYKQELQRKNKQMQELIQEVFEKTRLVKELQNQIDTLKKKSLAFNQKYGDDDNDDNINEMSFHNYLTNENLKHKYRRKPSEVYKNKPFIFDPVTSNQRQNFS